MNKIMHTPISTLKTAARDPESTTVVELVRRLFNLQDQELHEPNRRENDARAKDNREQEAASRAGSRPGGQN